MFRRCNDKFSSPEAKGSWVISTGGAGIWMCDGRMYIMSIKHVSNKRQTGRSAHAVAARFQPRPAAYFQRMDVA